MVGGGGERQEWWKRDVWEVVRGGADEKCRSERRGEERREKEKQKITQFSLMEYGIDNSDSPKIEWRDVNSVQGTLIARSF